MLGTGFVAFFADGGAVFSSLIFRCVDGFGEPACVGGFSLRGRFRRFRWLGVAPLGHSRKG